MYGLYRLRNDSAPWRAIDTRLAPGEAHLWLFSADIAEDERHACWVLLSPEEKDRANRFKFEIDRNRFTAVHGTLRLILGGYCRLAPETLDFSTGPYGKPALAAEPRIAFNLSHSAGFALVGVTAGSACGVDLEKTREDVSHGDIAERFFCQKEIDWLRSLRGDMRNKGFFSLWARKEAIIKATGLGLSMRLSDVNVISDQQNEAVIVLNGSYGEPPTPFWLRELNLLEGFACALAVANGPHKIRIMNPHTEGGSQRHSTLMRDSTE